MAGKNTEIRFHFVVQLHCVECHQCISSFTSVTLLYCTREEKKKKLVLFSFFFQIASALTDSVMKVNTDALTDRLCPHRIRAAPRLQRHMGPPSKWRLPIAYIPSALSSHPSPGVGVHSCSITKVGLLPAVSWRHKERGGEEKEAR